MKHHPVILRILISLLLLTLLAGNAAASRSPESFVLGVDVSELLSQESSGAVYYNTDGQPADALTVLAANGINHIRLRIWNDPSDARGRGYGGGNINAERAAILSARAAKLGMKTLIDFHYSDFWADPFRQIVPKAWAGMSLEEKETALADYTRESLSAILDAGGDVDLVQIGNETTTGMAGEYDADKMIRLMDAGCKAVRQTADQYGRQISACIHLTDPQDYGVIAGILHGLEIRGAPYDSVALSYYPYWHGTLENLSDVIRSIRNDFRKEVFIAETSWPFTTKDGDGEKNVVDYDPGVYPVTPEGQAQELETVCRAVRQAGGFGVFYWGGIWTPVGSNAKQNRGKWEKWGSGWATKFAHPYDPDHVGNKTGGCAWDNQAMFGFDGHPLPILDTVRRLAKDSSLSGQTPLPAAPDEGQNLVRNPSFEDPDCSMWETYSEKNGIPYDYQDFINDTHSGTVAFHFWSEEDMSFGIQQTVTDLLPGQYEVSVWSQGGDMTEANMVLYAFADGRYYECPFMNTAWAEWKHPVIEDIPVRSGSLMIGVKIQCGAYSWGTLDDFSVVKK